MSQASASVPVHEKDPAPVTIFDGRGRVLRIVSAEEFRRTHGIVERPTFHNRRRATERLKTSEVEQAALEK
jgi:hypothetical protein